MLRSIPSISTSRTSPRWPAGRPRLRTPSAATSLGATRRAVTGRAEPRPDNGTLTYKLRGQINSKFSPGLKLNAQLIVEDALRLMAEVKPSRPILVGLSIGGLFAARAWLQGAKSHGLVLINTLRRDGPRLRWIGDALLRASEVGGLDLFRDLFLPLLMNQDWLLTHR